MELDHYSKQMVAKIKLASYAANNLEKGVNIWKGEGIVHSSAGEEYGDNYAIPFWYIATDG